MTPGARLAAAAEVLSEILDRKAAADRVLARWGKAHRFAGSKDRAAIAERAYSVLRRLGECEALMGERSGRALVIGSLRLIDQLSIERIDALCVDGTHALGSLDEHEQKILNEVSRVEPAMSAPQWLREPLAAAFGEGFDLELAALNQRAPVDVRVNLIKADRDKVLSEFGALGLPARRSSRSVTGIRFDDGADPKVTAMECYLSGLVEVQDESSQLAVEFSGASAGETVVDLASGAGGKALALAAQMNNRGSVVVCDVDAERLARIAPRALRAGVTIIKMAGDPYSPSVMERLPGLADLVFVDAPCSGSGTWRRNPEAKWTLTPEMLDKYLQAQVSLLGRSATLAGPHGRIVYAVCSVLLSEGELQVRRFCESNPGWGIEKTLRLTPLRDQTDGFFAAMLRRVAQ